MLERVPPLLVVAAMVGVMFLPVAAAVPATIAIVVLSAILIACLKRGTAAYQFFTPEKVVFIGLISYSLCLWHWGVLCISRWTVGIHWWSAPLQVVLMLLLGASSFQWIETPLRKISLFQERWKAICFGFGILIVTAGILVGLPWTSTSKGLYLGDDKYISAEWKHMIDPQS